MRDKVSDRAIMGPGRVCGKRREKVERAFRSDAQREVVFLSVAIFSLVSLLYAQKYRLYVNHNHHY